jgi:hypothetical protein
MSNGQIIFLGIIAMIAVIAFAKKQKKSDRIPDDEINVGLIKGLLSNYRFKPSIARKNGFTEKDVQKDLFKYLKSKIENVTEQYALEGITKDAIDYDLGNGKIGLELKLSRKIYGANERNRALGQMVQYIKKKYRDGNYIVAVIGKAEDKDSSHYKELNKDITNHKGHLIFIETEEMAVIEKHENDSVTENNNS